MGNSSRKRKYLTAFSLLRTRGERFPGHALAVRGTVRANGGRGCNRRRTGGVEPRRGLSPMTFPSRSRALPPEPWRVRPSAWRGLGFNVGQAILLSPLVSSFLRISITLLPPYQAVQAPWGVIAGHGGLDVRAESGTTRGDDGGSYPLSIFQSLIVLFSLSKLTATLTTGSPVREKREA